MNIALLFVQTPRSDHNYRYLVPTENNAQESDVNRLMAEVNKHFKLNDHDDAFGDTYIAVRRRVQQITSNRSGDEIIVLFGVNPENMSEDERHHIISELRHRLDQEVEQLVLHRIDWQRDGKSLLVPRPELNDWIKPIAAYISHKALLNWQELSDLLPVDGLPTTVTVTKKSKVISKQLLFGGIIAAFLILIVFTVLTETCSSRNSLEKQKVTDEVDYDALQTIDLWLANYMLDELPSIKKEIRQLCDDSQQDFKKYCRKVLTDIESKEKWDKWASKERSDDEKQAINKINEFLKEKLGSVLECLKKTNNASISAENLIFVPENPSFLHLSLLDGNASLACNAEGAQIIIDIRRALRKVRDAFVAEYREFKSKKESLENSYLVDSIGIEMRYSEADLKELVPSENKHSLISLPIFMRPDAKLVNVLHRLLLKVDKDCYDSGCDSFRVVLKRRIGGQDKHKPAISEENPNDALKALDKAINKLNDN